MGSLETNLHLTATATSVPYVEHVPVTVNGASGYVPKNGRMSVWGFGTALDGRWTFSQFNRWVALTTGINGGFVTGNHHSALFASTFAGLHLTPPSTHYHVTIDAGYSLVKVNVDKAAYGTGTQNLSLEHGALIAFGVATALPQLCNGCQIGARFEASLSAPVYQERGLISIGYQGRTDSITPKISRPGEAHLPTPPQPPDLQESASPSSDVAMKSPVEVQLESVEDRINMIRYVFHKDLRTCLTTTEDIGLFLAWTRGDSGPASCRLPMLQPKLREIEVDLSIILAASAGHPNLHARIDAATTNLKNTTALLVQKGMELLVGPHADSRLSRIMIVGKVILASIGNKDQKVVIAAFMRYQAALNALQRIFNENALSMGRENTDLYKAPQQVVECLLTELSCPTNLATELTVPALKKRLGIK